MVMLLQASLYGLFYISIKYKLDYPSYTDKIQ